ncbi:LysR substrate-binding domain-containing protein [Negadavirga shengliensis]|uniref:LysR substrate-binding domain-containing protein n=1 Tax=Negadavirga shengliensis TaxID=1389218 RepID=A0ABV9T7H3_9BACT
MNYTLHQLLIFKTVAHFGSITKAGESLFLTQPAVSLQLKKFQEQFDYPLIEIIGKKLYLTDFGGDVLLYAHKILEEAEAINQITAIRKGELVGRLKIAIVSTAKYIMPYFLTDFLKKHPQVELSMDVANKARVIHSLRENQADFGMVSLLPEALEVNGIEIMENKLYLVANSGLAVKSKNAEKIFAEHPIIFREKGSGTRLTMERFLISQNITANKSLELTSNEAVKQAILAGIGISVMPLIGIKEELKSGLLKIIDIKGLPISTKWHLIWLKQKEFSPVNKAFIKELENNKDQIVQRFLPVI